jgi:sugar phosphate isomerase/epimerase
MRFTGIGDEAGNALASQIAAVKELRWNSLELRNVEVPGWPKANLHELPEAAFEKAVEMLGEAHVSAACLGTTVMNWAKTLETPFETTLSEVSRVIPRARRLGVSHVRIMSFKPGDAEDRIPSEVIRRVREVVDRLVDAGLTPVHENCMNYGGMSPAHALELLAGVPGLRWVFDTANPVFNPDRSKSKPWPRQDAWTFWEAVRDRVEHIHVKDAHWDVAKGDAVYTWPGEGDGAVARVLGDAASRGYRGFVSIEPHMVAVFHDANSVAADEALRANFIEYGRRLEALVGKAAEAP